MIIEERTYTLFPGKLKEFIALYQGVGLPIQTRILKGMVGFFHTEIGELNQVVHWWRYESMEERARLRAELSAAEGWEDYVARVTPLFCRQESRILNPLPWSPLR